MQVPTVPLGSLGSTSTVSDVIGIPEVTAVDKTAKTAGGPSRTNWLMSGFDAGKVTAVPLAVALTLTWLVGDDESKNTAARVTEDPLAVALTLTWLVGDDESKNDVPGVTVPTYVLAGMPVPETGRPWSPR